MTAQELGPRVLLAGEGSAEMSCIFAAAQAEAGAKLVVLDLDGSASRVPGRATESYRSFAYEAFHVEGEDAFHGELVCAAYALALDLPSDEEAVLASAMQHLSAQSDMATPASLYEVLGGVEGFRGPYVDRLRGRLAGLKLLETARSEPFELTRGATVRFDGAPYPQAAELMAALFLAKLLAASRLAEGDQGPVMITGSHRLFRSHGSGSGRQRLSGMLLDMGGSLVVASRFLLLLDGKLAGSLPVRVLSSDAWNREKRGLGRPAGPGSYVVTDLRSGLDRLLIPRLVRGRESEGAEPRGRAPPPASPELTKAVVLEVSRSGRASRQSLIDYLSPLFLKADVADEIDRLHAAGAMDLEPVGDGSGPAVFSYRLTGSGTKLLMELTG